MAAMRDGFQRLDGRLNQMERTVYRVEHTMDGMQHDLRKMEHKVDRMQHTLEKVGEHVCVLSKAVTRRLPALASNVRQHAIISERLRCQEWNKKHPLDLLEVFPFIHPTLLASFHPTLFDFAIVHFSLYSLLLGSKLSW